MVTVKIKENSKQARAIIEMLRSFPFVEVLESRYNATTEKAIRDARERKGIIHTNNHEDLMEKLRS